MSKHTPGPWRVGAVNHKKQYTDIDTNARDDRLAYASWTGLARTYGCEDDPIAGSEVMAANARLIAAAPELFEALKSWVVYDTDDTDDGAEMMIRYDKALTMTRAAIAKAEDAQ